MSYEIERKFLLSGLPAGLDANPARRIEQGYLAVEDVEVRLRRIDGETVLTIKSAPGLVRVEEEMPIEEHRFETLWPLTEGRRVVKTRYLVPVGELTAEVDVYAEALDGLLTAEVEFASVEQSEAFSAPGWMGDEVTGDDRYANRSLAIDGRPT